MDKIVWLFRRKHGMTRAAFHDHYVDVHSLFALRAHREIEGYTVNLVESEGTELDAVTELWTRSAADMMAGKTYTSAGARKAFIADHKSFIGRQEAFAVEEEIVVDGSIDMPGEGPWSKSVSVYRIGEDPDVRPRGVFRVVDNHVVQTLLVGDRHARDATGLPSDVRLLRMIWADDGAALPASGPLTVRVRERRNVVLPP